MDLRWERIFIRDTYTKQSEYARINRKLVKSLLKDVVDDFNNAKEESMLKFFDVLYKNVRKAHSFRCGMDSTKIKNNVYVDIENIHIL